MRFSAILIFSGTLFLYSCGQQQEEKKKEVTSQVMEDHHQNKTDSIELNNGEKWKVDENMITHIRNMENDVSNFKGTTLTEYKTLSENLQKNVDLLTSNCTMKGKAHDELHKWLLPYIDLVKKLSEAKDEIKAAKQLEYIQTSFSTFNQYFQ